MAAAASSPWSILVAMVVIMGHVLVMTHSLPVSEEKGNDIENKDIGTEDVIDPTEVRSKRQVDYYNNYYYDTNFKNNNCGFRRFLTSMGLGINSYYTPYNSNTYNSRSRRLLRNRQPFLYNGRRGLYAPSRYFTSTSTYSNNNSY